MGSYITAGPARGQCGLCGRIRLSHSEYSWRRKNGLPVWRCQHRRSTKAAERELVKTAFLIVVLAGICVGIVAYQWIGQG